MEWGEKEKGEKLKGKTHEGKGQEGKRGSRKSKGPRHGSGYALLPYALFLRAFFLLPLTLFDARSYPPPAVDGGTTPFSRMYVTRFP
jgi:hypothetical protein